MARGTCWKFGANDVAGSLAAHGRRTKINESDDIAVHARGASHSRVISAETVPDREYSRPASAPSGTISE